MTYTSLYQVPNKLSRKQVDSHISFLDGVMRGSGVSLDSPLPTEVMRVTLVLQEEVETITLNRLDLESQ